MARTTRPKPGQELGRKTLSRVVRYLVWDCSSCGIKGLNSNKCKQCPQCGNSKDASDNEERSQDIVDANYKYKGADITCQFCGTQNEARFSCKQCGAALDKKFEKQVANFVVGPTALVMPERKVQIDNEGFRPDATDTPWTAGSGPVVLQEPKGWEDEPPEPYVSTEDEPEVKVRAKRSTPQVTTSSESTSGLWILIITAIVAVLLMIGVYVYNQLNTFTQSTATVSSVSWTYSLPREDYAARDHSYETENDFWRPPSGAFAINDRNVIVRYEPIFDQVWVSDTCTRTEYSSYNDTDGTWVTQTDLVTYDCSGYQTKQVGTDPIEGTRWTWKEMEWATTTPLTARGDNYDVVYPPFVPTKTLRQAGQPVTRFNITFSFKDDENDIGHATRSYPRSVWEQTSIGARYDAVIDGFDRLRAVSGLDPDYQKLLE